MAKKERLNIDVASSVFELETAVKEFELKRKFYKTLFRGKALEFEGYRTYGPDDDASFIDWKASKRANQTLVRQYKEESDMKIIFAIDVGDNMVFGSTKKIKCEYAGEIAASLGHLIINSNDKLGFLLYSDKITKFSAPEGGAKTYDLFMEIVSDPNNYSGFSRLEPALDFLIDNVDPSVKSLIIISDFLKTKEDLKKKLQLIGSKFETIAIMVRDPLDKALPDISEEVIIEDPSSGEQVLINPKLAKHQYERNVMNQEQLVKKLFKESNIDLLEVTTDKPFVPVLAEFLKERLEVPI